MSPTARSPEISCLVELRRPWAVSTVLNSLTLMLYLLVPWTPLNLVDFFFVRRGHYAITDIFRVDGVYGAWNWRGLLAYALGFASEIPFMVLFPIAGFFLHRPDPGPPH